MSISSVLASFRNTLAFVCQIPAFRPESQVQGNGLAFGPRIPQAHARMEQLDVEDPPAISLPSPESLQSLLESLPDTRRKVVQAWVDGLSAKKWTWDVSAKRRVYEPDHRERRENAKLLAAYLDGLPKETTVVKVETQKGGIAELREAARASPAVREALREMLDELERPALPS